MLFLHWITFPCRIIFNFLQIVRHILLSRLKLCTRTKLKKKKKIQNYTPIDLTILNNFPIVRFTIRLMFCSMFSISLAIVSILVWAAYAYNINWNASRQFICFIICYNISIVCKPFKRYTWSGLLTVFETQNTFVISFLFRVCVFFLINQNLWWCLCVCGEFNWV